MDKRSDKGNGPKDDSREVRDDDWPILVRLKPTIGNPQGGIDRSTDRLQGRYRVPGEVENNLINIRGVHNQTGDRGNIADHFCLAPTLHNFFVIHSRYLLVN